MVMKKLSIIIPTYNNADVLNSTVRTVINNDSPDIEIIIVDDGSMVEVSKSLHISDSRIHIYRQSNSGVSMARNTGIGHAKGQYILFVDADDSLGPCWGQTLDQIDGSDMILFNYGTNHGTVQNINKLKKLSGEQFRNYSIEMIENPTKNLTVWGKFLKKSVIDRNHISFNGDLSFAEDGEFMLQFLSKAKTAKLVPQILYHYQPGPNSVMSRPNKSKVAAYIRALDASAYQLDNTTVMNHAYAFYVAMHFNVMMVHQVFLSGKLSEQVSQMKQLIKVPIISKSLGEIKLRECKKPRLLPIMMLKLHVYWVAGLMYKIRAYQNNRSLA